ncbi:hypothetical protein GXW71_30435 [Roseomonas hellenica]|uniref:Porin n=1 Tax=Plastoroseomonas hellenica TaxID=2687306 RepID=A0ABS5F8D3_9PROT|nr:hypothetical protein [Plastoroseomonas hellenica]MBR0668708.1 hypothetical protein [Plastoroseomonas hellenica]
MRRALLLLAALLATPAAAQEGLYPQIAGEVNLGLYTNALTRMPDQRRQGAASFLFGEIAAGLHLSPNLSIQGILHIEPVGEQEPNDGWIAFRRQGASLENLVLDWRPVQSVSLFAGKFSAPFGRGHHDFPGIFPMIRAHEAYLVTEALGFGARWTFLSDPTFGEHDLTAATFTLDRTFLSETLITRRRCCAEGYERYSRNTAAQGGPGNTGRLNNFAVALDGDNFSWAPGLSYHLSAITRGQGSDGTAREWGYAAALRYEARWTETLRTLFFAEHVVFRSAGGRPLEEVVDSDGNTADTGVSERRRFTTLGARTSYGPWRATIAWQQDQRKRSANTVPTERYTEISVGRDLGWGFSVDAGWQFVRYARDDGSAGDANGPVAVLRYRTEF